MRLNAPVLRPIVIMRWGKRLDQMRFEPGSRSIWIVISTLLIL